MNPPMTYSKSGLELTERFEGCRLLAYQDVRGIWTIGFGHTGPDVCKGLVISDSQATNLLMRDTGVAQDAVNELVDYPLTQPEFDALVDFVFNIGRLAFKCSTLLRLLNAGDIPGAAEQFLVWDHAGGAMVSGLLRRRISEQGEFDAAQAG